jgi:hypothetical protein
MIIFLFVLYKVIFLTLGKEPDSKGGAGHNGRVCRTFRVLRGFPIQVWNRVNTKASPEDGRYRPKKYNCVSIRWRHFNKRTGLLQQLNHDK